MTAALCDHDSGVPAGCTASGGRSGGFQCGLDGDCGLRPPGDRPAWHACVYQVLSDAGLLDAQVTIEAYED